MKITKNQLRKLIREEIQSERVTPEQAADPNFDYGEMLMNIGRKQEAGWKLDHEIVKEIDKLVQNIRGIKALPEKWAPRLLDKIESALAKRKG